MYLFYVCMTTLSLTFVNYMLTLKKYTSDSCMCFSTRPRVQLSMGDSGEGEGYTEGGGGEGGVSTTAAVFLRNLKSTCVSSPGLQKSVGATSVDPGRGPVWCLLKETEGR